ncbi:MAG: exodeoxyribonuclease VII large subunit [Patescibacteria group bacterium]|nr:exodeoxyribonuclease VII large subunit [Patescibacteria group bacterium]
MQKTLAKPLTVSEFISLVKIHLQTAIGRVTVQGEVFGFKIRQDKFVWFGLKDETSIVNCFMMKYKLQIPVEDGMEVKVTGYPTVFPRKGTFNLTVELIEPVGEGALQRAFELLKKQLEKEGLFDLERKRSIPRFPSKIGIVSSPDADAYHDVNKILQNRWGGLEIILTPVNVQGVEAISQIVGALKYQNEIIKPSVIILTRGGGSLEDLQAFNSEEVARAIFSSKVPVVCGVGHERDITIADLVADIRASTPSNAAERVVPDRREILYQINTLVRDMENEVTGKIETYHQEINDSVRRIDSVFRDKIRYWHELMGKFQRHFWLFDQRLVYFRKDISERTSRLGVSLNANFIQAREKLSHLKNLLRSFSPENVLARGYSITLTSAGKAVTSTGQVEINDTIVTKLKRGQLDSTIIKKQ